MAMLSSTDLLIELGGVLSLMSSDNVEERLPQLRRSVESARLADAFYFLFFQILGSKVPGGGGQELASMYLAKHTSSVRTKPALTGTRFTDPFSTILDYTEKPPQSNQTYHKIRRQEPPLHLNSQLHQSIKKVVPFTLIFSYHFLYSRH